MFFDYFELKIINNLQTFNIDNTCRLFSKPFNTNYFIILSILLYLLKIFNFNDLIILYLGTLIILIIKIIVKRKRPYNYSSYVLNKSKKTHGKKLVKGDYFSFPSGHSFCATVFTLIMMQKFSKAYILIFIPILVGFSRIYLGVHYISDVVFGIIFGSIYFNIIKKYIY